MHARIGLVSLALLLAPAACGQATGADAREPSSMPSDYAVSMSMADAASVLALVNYPGMDVAVLDQEVGLDSRAAGNIVSHRNGADGVSPSADDVYFADLGQLDAIPYVGDTAFQKLQTYGATHAVPSAETVEGVYFRGWESESVVWAVNHLEPSVLDAVLDSRAVKGLVAVRPLASVSAMGPIAFVGPGALESLRTSAPSWWTLMHGAGAQSLAGTFDGVTFDEPTAQTALAIANEADQSELVAHGMTASPASLLVAARPFVTLAAVAGLGGVGPASMQALHDYAASGQWGAPSDPNACTEAFDAAVSPHLGDLLLMSESDRPIDVVSFPGAGATAPSPASVLALVGTTAGSTAELRSLEDFGVALEPSSDDADPNAAASVLSVISAQLQDVIYVKIHAPAGSLYQAEVHVYVVGRTPCGDLVGLHSIAIET